MSPVSRRQLLSEPSFVSAMKYLGLLVALAIVLCTAVEPARGEDETCNEKCQMHKMWLKSRKDMQDCQKKYNFTKGLSFKNGCDATLDEEYVKFKVCTSRVQGVVFQNYSLNTEWWNNRTRGFKDRCIAYNEMVKENEGWSDQHMERFCNHTATLKEIMDKCFQAGKAAETADEGVSAMRAMLKCHCEAFMEAWQRHLQAKKDKKEAAKKK